MEVRFHALIPYTGSCCQDPARFILPGNRLPLKSWSTSPKTISNSTPWGRYQRRIQTTWEEHLLICQSCRDRVESTDEYVAAMCSAAGKIRGS